MILSLELPDKYKDKKQEILQAFINFDKEVALSTSECTKYVTWEDKLLLDALAEAIKKTDFS